MQQEHVRKSEFTPGIPRAALSHYGVPREGRVSLQRGRPIKKRGVVSLAFAVILSMTAFAQYSSKELAQRDQATQAPLKSIEGTVKVEGDKITFVAETIRSPCPSKIQRRSKVMKATTCR